MAFSVRVRTPQDKEQEAGINLAEWPHGETPHHIAFLLGGRSFRPIPLQDQLVFGKAHGLQVKPLADGNT